MKLDTATQYFRERVNELRLSCKDGTPWTFLSASAFLEYLTKLINGEDNGGKGYKDFVRNWLSEVRLSYKEFVYKNGKQDLDVQMYHVLRCGIVHGFSLIPDETGRTKGGRDRSIILCHAKERDEHGWTHLMQYSKPSVPDAALFVAEDFVDDIEKITNLIFDRAANDQGLRIKIERWLRAHPPISGAF